MLPTPTRRPGALLLFCLLFSGFPTGMQAQWTPQADSIFGPYFAVQTLQATDSNTVWAGASTSSYTTVPTLRPWVIRTTDGGANWEYDTIPGTAGYLIGSIAALDANTCWASLIWFDDPNRHRLYRTTDGGLSWQLQLEDRSAGGIVHFFDPLNGVALNRNYYRYTADGGTTWSGEGALGLPDSMLYLPLAGSYTALGNTLWVTTVLQQLARSTDKGQTWDLIDLPFLGNDDILSMISFADGQNGMAASPYYFYPPRFFTTADGGLTWSQITPPPPVAGEVATVEAVEAIPGKPGWYVVQCSDFNLNIAQTWLSKDSGVTWSLKGQEPALNYAGFALHFESERHGWAGLGGFGAEQACIYHWNTPIGLKGENPPNINYGAGIDRPATGKPVPPARRWLPASKMNRGTNASH
ncbi:MAG: hypothetical protein L6Q97_18380 [Thermoanaerobaculia bacterium]|nr:hypothetical protein [Thermoanaerobaculia bacterium]